MAKETITDELNAMQNPPETPDPLMEIGAVNTAIDQGAADTGTNTIDDTAKANDGLRHDYYKRPPISKCLASWSNHISSNAQCPVPTVLEFQNLTTGDNKQIEATKPSILKSESVYTDHVVSHES
ncbi:hypothetical protein E4U14_002690 [Claviceps sp. LM454 group G7]|nr:hypothetical protein E4U14_002690 [Claviceps sp. LM454 group G7]